MEDLRRGQVPDHLIYGILALSARYDPSYQTQGVSD
jgi:hypothetical protein